MTETVGQDERSRCGCGTKVGAIHNTKSSPKIVDLMSRIWRWWLRTPKLFRLVCASVSMVYLRLVYMYYKL